MSELFLVGQVANLRRVGNTRLEGARTQIAE